jgi:hypothetical protein
MPDVGLVGDALLVRAMGGGDSTFFHKSIHDVASKLDSLDLVSSENEHHGPAVFDRVEPNQANVASQLFAERNGTRTLVTSIGASRCGKCPMPSRTTRW